MFKLTHMQHSLGLTTTQYSEQQHNTMSTVEQNNPMLILKMMFNVASSRVQDDHQDDPQDGPILNPKLTSKVTRS